MTHTYNVTGMTCEGCKAKVTRLLTSVSGVKQVNIDLSKGEVAIEMEKHISTPQLAEALKEYPKYKISDSPHQMKEKSIIQEDEKSWLATYKPLLTVFAFITLVSLLTSFHDGRILGMQWMGNFMAGFFLVFSFFKMLDLKGFADSYAMYDIVAKKIKVYGLLYPFIELALGIAYLINFNAIITNWATIVVMGVSIIGVAQSVLNKKKIRCACLGAVFNLPMSTVTIVEDLLMIVMAIIMLVVL